MKVKIRYKLKAQTCGNCKFYEDCLVSDEGINDIYKDKVSCGDWEQDRNDEELEAQNVDAAERENHRKEVEGDIL